MKRSSTRSKRNRRKRFAKRKGRRNKRPAPPEDPTPPIPVRVQKIREKVWQCMGVASCIEYASDSMLTATRIKPDIQNAAAALFDMLSELGGPLEEVMEGAGGLPDVEDEE